MRDSFFYRHCLRWSQALILIVLLSGCNSSSSSSEDDKTAPTEANLVSCAAEDQKQYVWDVMRYGYLWNEHLPASIDLSQYDSLDAVLDASRYKNDKYSYITTKAAYDDRANNVSYASGVYYYFVRNKEGKRELLIRYTQDNSPAKAAGMVRGDRITHANGETIQALYDKLPPDTSLMSSIIKDGKAVTWQWTNIDGAYKSATFAPAEYSFSQTRDLQFFDTSSSKVAYFAFDAFTAKGADDLTKIFKEIKPKQVDTLILDLRYNGGGSVRVSNQLASNIAGALVDDKVYVQFKHNAVLAEKEDAKEKFKVVASESLNLNKVYVLTTDYSCSASESVINSLRPHMEVVTVGETTCGKPVGMYGYPFCESVFFPISFATQNSQGEGDYFDGIKPDCYVYDWPEYANGDKRDSMIKQALTLVDGGRCERDYQAFNRPFGGSAESIPRADRIQPIEEGSKEIFDPNKVFF